MGQTSDQLRQEIAAKRDDAAAKIDQIEARVQELPNLAKETVRGTVDASIQQAKDTVDQSLTQAREAVVDKVGTMKQQADLTTKIDERPLAALGIAFAGGYLLGKVLGGDDKHRAHHDRGHAQGTYRTDWSQAHSSQSHLGHSGHDAPAGSGMAAGAAMGAGMGLASSAALGSSGGATPGYGSHGYEGQQHHGPGAGSSVMNALKQAAQQAGLDQTLSSLTGALVATLTDQFNRTVEETFPDFAKHLKEQGGLGSAQQTGGARQTGRMGGSGSMGSGGFGAGSGSSREGLAGSGASGAGMGAGGEYSGTDSGSRAAYGQDAAAGDNARTFGAGGEGTGADWNGPFPSGASGASVSEMPGDQASAGSTDVTGSRTPYYGGGSSSAGMGGTTP